MKRRKHYGAARAFKLRRGKRIKRYGVSRGGVRL